MVASVSILGLTIIEVIIRKIFIPAFIFCLLTVAFVSSCFIEDDDYFDTGDTVSQTISETPIATNPGSTTVISITSSPTVTASAANIFRQACGSEDFAKDVEDAVNIGQIVSSSKLSEISFIDSFTDQNKYYRYAIRYKVGNSFKITKYSDIVQGTGTGEAELTGTATLSYDSSDYTLSTAEAITVPSGFSEAHLVLTCGTQSAAVQIGTISSTTLASGSATESLQSELPSAFLGNETTVKYIIAAKKGSDDDSAFYYFTNPVTATVQITSGSTTETVETITVPAASESSSDTGIYYN